MPLFGYDDSEYAEPTYVSRRDVTRVAKIGHLYLRRAGEASYSPVFSRIEKENALASLALAEKIEALAIPAETNEVEHVRVVPISPMEAEFLENGRKLERYGQVFLG